ncbi:LPS translocon maturation chaperone LptM [Chitinilyticum aquatile]|uniref:LPS translocon maturation chaperone LptM n=1 Tax=Chitinilyticum aquatile TaxID=362520 RepID=UPI0003FCA8C9|nr:lipoprotein [Chitinilyticum aquatile]
MRKFILISLSLGLLAACGFKGPLYLPDSEKGKKRTEHEQRRASAAAAAASAAAAAAAKDAEIEATARRKASMASAMQSENPASTTPQPDNAPPASQP